MPDIKRYIDIEVFDEKTIELEKELAWEEFRQNVEAWKQSVKEGK